MRLNITRRISLSLGEVLLYATPFIVALVGIALCVPVTWLKVALPVACVVNGLWWAYVWQHKLAPRAAHDGPH